MLGAMADDDLDAAWKAGDSKARDAAARVLGVKLDDKLAGAITALLDKANGKRRKFLLSYADVLRAVSEAVASPHGIAVRHGGAEFLGKTSLCLAVKRGDGVVIGIGVCWADRPTPGRLWKPLGPWQQDFARNVEKATAWAAAKAADRVFVPTTKPSKSKSAAKQGGASGKTLLAHVLAHPEDDAARLVYSDWLLQQGDPRGELIAVQCALVTTPPAKRRALVKREKELLRKHRKTWTKEAMQVAIECRLSRGFVDQVKATSAAFASKGAVLFDHDPIEELVLSKPTGGGLKVLGAAAHLARLRSLRFSSPYWLQSAKDVASLHEFLRSKHLGRVRELTMNFQNDQYLAPMPEIGELFHGVSWPAVETFSIVIDGGAKSYACLAKAKLPALKQLTVPLKKPAELSALRAAFPGAKIGRG